MIGSVGGVLVVQSSVSLWRRPFLPQRQGDSSLESFGDGVFELDVSLCSELALAALDLVVGLMLAGVAWFGEEWKTHRQSHGRPCVSFCARQVSPLDCLRPT